MKATSKTAEQTRLPGIIAELGDLPPDTVVTEVRLAQWLNRCIRAVRRAVQRGELPPPSRLCGTNVWTVGALVDHINARLDEALKERARVQSVVDLHAMRT